MMKTEKRTIYIELLGEGTPCWRPVEAEYLGDERYRIIEAKPQDEVWPFSTGDVVKCEPKSFNAGGREPVACEKVRG